MLIRSSDQVPRVTVLKRFPVPRNFNVSSESRIERGTTDNPLEPRVHVVCTLCYVRARSTKEMRRTFLKGAHLKVAEPVSGAAAQANRPSRCTNGC